ncbi:hypothetical protein CRI93_10990 [Longimonas halophila]|uniref:Outer membrane lipoprotein-sorting protein n=1 Tax=Longimonas halophila TaxID=1469170 RepID=A0A2H3NK41_9BACT|nr:DUF6503 family protein [Longimonas halophila]PEN05999.1 hypothetical protein CRI93_10990 [Longimonas halophila]
MMRLLSWIPLLLALIVLPACTADAPESNEPDAAQTERPDAPAALHDAWAAHGGLDTWRNQRQMRYTLARIAGSDTTRDDHLIDLQTRNVRITNGDFVLGFDGSDAWVQPSLEAFPYDYSPRFYTSTYFYFFAMPFVLADDGVIASDAGTATINGTDYRVTEIRYEDNVGDSPDDVYIVYTEADTGALGLVRFSVTYGDRPPDAPNTALVYNEFATNSGLTLPVEGRYHAWADSTLGDPLGPQFALSDLTFETEAPDSALFAKPDSAEVDPLPGSRADSE